MKRNGIQAKKWRKYLKYLAFKLQNYQITCQLFVLREEKSREISRPNLKEFRNGETLVSKYIVTKNPHRGKKALKCLAKHGNAKTSQMSPRATHKKGRTNKDPA
jgi:hypothetical protein